MKTKAEILCSTAAWEVFAWIKANGLDVEVCELFNQLVKKDPTDEMVDDLALRAIIDKT